MSQVYRPGLGMPFFYNKECSFLIIEKATPNVQVNTGLVKHLFSNLNGLLLGKVYLRLNEALLTT